MDLEQAAFSSQTAILSADHGILNAAEALLMGG